MERSHGGVSRVLEVDMLRFVAAISVVIFHYSFRGFAADGYTKFSIQSISPVTQYGYLGVNLFFIISGFVILMTAQHGCLKRFVISRITRLYPAFWASCTLTAVVILVANDHRFSVNLFQWLVNMTMMSGFAGIRSIDGVYWSLFVELKFYLLVVALIHFNKLRFIENYLFGWLVVSMLLLVKPLPYLYALFIPQHAPYFVSGAIFYLIYRDGWRRKYTLLLAASFFMSLYVSWRECEQLKEYFSGVVFNNHIVMSVVSLFFAVFVLVTQKITQKVVRPWFVIFGALTYPLYLVHQNIGYVILNKIPTEYYGGHVLLFLVVFMLLLAWMLHSEVERRYSKLLRIWLEKVLLKTGSPT